MAEFDIKRYKILLIDDEWFIRTTIRQILLQIGFGNNVYEASDAQTGMSETLRIQPSLVLCDIHMPGGEDGLAYLGRLRKAPLPDVAATPVVMLTSDRSSEAVLTAKELGIDGYLVKPVSVATVKRAVERALKITLP
ncbi:Response regulatory domain-containing protein [uncultured Gammaproteobacteria bacterium]